MNVPRKTSVNKNREQKAPSETWLLVQNMAVRKTWTCARLCHGCAMLSATFTEKKVVTSREWHASSVMIDW